MSSIVLDLQQEVLRDNCDILNVLRKAHVIARKLQLVEFDGWIMSELNGYSDYKSIPDYRTVTGALKAWNPYNGWIPVLFNDNGIEQTVCTRKLGESLSDLIELEQKSNSTFFIQFNAEMAAMIASMSTVPFQTQYSLHISTHKLRSICEKVKNTILEWTIRLEAEGILGEGMQFNSTEKETAKRIPQTINNYYGNTNVINAPVDRSAVIAGDDNSVEFTYEKANEVTSEIETSLESEELTEEDKETALEMLSEIKDKISQQKKPSVIKSALIGFKDFLIGVGASATVAVIDAKLKGLI